MNVPDVLRAVAEGGVFRYARRWWPRLKLRVKMRWLGLVRP